MAACTIEHIADFDGDLFECGICTDELNIPKSLPCLHNFCQDCLLKYFKINDISDDQVFSCPVCRADTVVPGGGARTFPTNFLIETLRKRRSSLDFGFTIKDAMQFWETKEEEITEQLSERKRQLLIDVSARRDEIIVMMDAYIEGMQERLEDRYIDDACNAVQAIQAAKTKLAELQSFIAPNIDEEDVWERLKRQGETMSNIANEIEEVKSTTDGAIADIMAARLAFAPGVLQASRLQYHFGSLVKRTVRTKKTEQNVMDYVIHNGQLSVLTFLNWSQSWWILLLGFIPALIIAVVMRVFFVFIDSE